MTYKICEICGKPIRDMSRHMRGYRVKDKKGNIIKIPRCIRQHRRYNTVVNNRHPMKRGNPPHSQGY